VCVVDQHEHYEAEFSDIKERETYKLGLESAWVWRGRVMARHSTLLGSGCHPRPAAAAEYTSGDYTFVHPACFLLSTSEV
jgi:hypothetical protein